LIPTIALLLAGHWSTPVEVWAKNPYTLRWYVTRESWWIPAAQPQLENPTLQVFIREN
jgi:hypothetical protein